MIGDAKDPDWSEAEWRIVHYLRRTVGCRVSEGARNAANDRYYDFTLNDVEPADGKSPGICADSATMRNRAGESAKRGGQARTLVFDVRDSMMTEAEARRGVARIRGLRGPTGQHGHRVDRVLVIGFGFYFEEVL